MASISLATRLWIRSFNWPLAIASVLVTLLGLITIQSANLHAGATAAGEYRKQAFSMILGVALMLFLSNVDYRNWRRWAPIAYAFTVLSLIFILIAGHHAQGAVRWISLGPLGQFQPSEPAKLFLAITIAAALTRGSYKRLTDLWLPLLLAFVPALLILRQPDLGTTLVILAILTTQLYLGLPKLAHFAAYFAALVLSGVVLLKTNIIKPFQKARLLVFLNPKLDPQGAGYNLNQSKIAVGNGGWLGQGLHHGTQTQLNFVPEHSRDFVFTVLGEELGFAGAVLLLILYSFIIFGGIRTMLVARDRFGYLVAAGLVAMLVFHIMVNIGMTIGIMPITGIPLPFMSYGGSAILTDYAAIGILLNIYSQKDRGVLGNA
ncbi:MAG: rod shape-determining protein RodA [Candidatus Eremiobacteraeota bacterium]|nr:rod shape-determining protein RodA [Candidatus Eremiobacteraeota bacterium]